MIKALQNGISLADSTFQIADTARQLAKDASGSGASPRLYDAGSVFSPFGSQHYVQVTEATYRIFQAMEGKAKRVRLGGRVLLAYGVTLDALELLATMQDDLNDADGKLGKASASTACSIMGRWTGTLVGAKYGAMAGAKIGFLISPLVGPAVGALVLGFVGGMGGGTLGERLGEWVIDITDMES
ncbi:MAG TPA: hypothetical protein PK597_00380 [Oscillospiraceae bacterium]|nr:hypothetical protein [Oscillospiraceae bacterium]